MSESAGISRQVMVMSSAKLEMIKCENNVFSGCVDRYNLSAWPKKVFKNLWQISAGDPEVSIPDRTK